MSKTMIRIWMDESGQVRMDTDCRAEEAIAALGVGAGAHSSQGDPRSDRRTGHI